MYLTMQLPFLEFPMSLLKSISCISICSHYSFAWRASFYMGSDDVPLAVVCLKSLYFAFIFEEMNQILDYFYLWVLALFHIIKNLQSFLSLFLNLCTESFFYGSFKIFYLLLVLNNLIMMHLGISLFIFLVF